MRLGKDSHRSMVGSLWLQKPLFSSSYEHESASVYPNASPLRARIPLFISVKGLHINKFNGLHIANKMKTPMLPGITGAKSVIIWCPAGNPVESLSVVVDQGQGTCGLPRCWSCQSPITPDHLPCWLGLRGRHFSTWLCYLSSTPLVVGADQHPGSPWVW